MYRYLIENALDAVVGINSRQEILTWNRQAEATFGWSAEEVSAKAMKLIDIIPPKLRSQHQSGFDRYLSTGENRILNRRLELSALHKSGREFPVELTVIPVEREDGLFFYAYLRDISDRIAWRQKEESQRRELSEMVKERELLLSIASHEIKTPLTSLKLRMQLLELLVNEPNGLASSFEEIRKSLKICLDQTDRITTMCNDLFDLAKIQNDRFNMNRKSVNPKFLLLGVLERFSEDLKKYNCTVDVSGEILSKCYWDPNYIERAVYNIMSNFTKYAPGCQLKVKLSQLDSQRICMSFSDNGPGMSEKSLESIFKPYSLIEKGYSKGLGLGLYIVKNIIEGHGGEVRVLSQVGVGTEFILEIPTHDGRTLASTAAAENEL